MDGADAAGAPARHALTLLGGFTLVAGDRVVGLPATSQRLVALLALRGRSSRSRLAGTLWPESSEERALASLRTVIWRVGHAAPGLVVTADGAVRLAPGADVDLQRFKTSVAALVRAPGAGEDWSGLVATEGELLPDWSDEWLVPHRERLRQLRLHALEAAADRLAHDGRYGLALEAALAALQADPLRESAHRAVIRVHMAEGNVVEARRTYRECSLLLRRELGVEPCPETSRLVPGPLDRARRPAPVR